MQSERSEGTAALSEIHSAPGKGCVQQYNRLLPAYDGKRLGALLTVASSHDAVGGHEIKMKWGTHVLWSHTS